METISKSGEKINLLEPHLRSVDLNLYSWTGYYPAANCGVVLL